MSPLTPPDVEKRPAVKPLRTVKAPEPIYGRAGASHGADTNVMYRRSDALASPATFCMSLSPPFRSFHRAFPSGQRNPHGGAAV
jgi:hypothetical protein